MTSMLKAVDEIRKYAAKVKVDKSTFLSVVFYFEELRVVLVDLTTKDDSLKGPPTPELCRLESSITRVLNLMKRYSQQGRIHLLLNTAKVVAEVQDAIQEVGHCLNLFPVLRLMSSVSSELHDKLADIRVKMRAAMLEPEPGNIEIAQAIREGLAEHIDDSRHATSLLQRILTLLELPVSEAETLQDEVQEDLSAAEGQKRDTDAQQLWELKRFLSRATLLSDVRRMNLESPAGLRVQKRLSEQAPNSYKCSITGHVMKDPVTLVEVGKDYERSAIETWFAKGNRTCPDTGQELHSLELVPNIALRNTIDEDFDCLNQKTLAVSVASLDLDSSAEELKEALEALNLLTVDKKYAQHVINIGGILPLVKLISSLELGDTRTNTLEVLTKLANLDEASQMAIVEVGALQPLLKICADEGPQSAPAVRLLLELSNSAAARTAITDELGVITLVKLLNSHNDGEVGELTERVLEKFWMDDSYVAIQMASAGMFKPLAVRLGPENDLDTRLLMADAVMTWGVNMASRVHLVEAGVLPPLLDLLINGPPEGTVAAVRALEHLSHTEANRVALAKAGVISGLARARSRGSAEVIEAAKATLANLAMDDQDLDALDEDGTTVHLIDMLRTTTHTNREYAVRTLEQMVRDSRTMRSHVLQDKQAIPAVFELLQEVGSQFAGASVRFASILLLSHLCQEPAGRQAMVASPQVVTILTSLLEKPISTEERDAIVIILSSMGAIKEMRTLVAKEENVIPILGKCLLTGNPKVKEAAFMALAKLADPSDLETQLKVVKLGIISSAIEYLRLGPDVMRFPAALLMGNLSLSTPNLMGRSNERSFRKTLSAPFKMRTGPEKDKKMPHEKRKQCRVHSGKCSLDATFCLVEGDVLQILLELLEKGGPSVAEASLVAISSLLEDKQDQEKVVDYLVREGIIELASKLVGKDGTATERAVWVLERIFYYKKYKQPRYSQPAISALGRFMTTATGSSRKVAADALMRLDILPKVSITE